MTTTLDIVALASAIAYPLVLLIILLLYRKGILALIKNISGRVTKLEVVGFSLELAKAERFNPTLQIDDQLDLRQKAEAMLVNDSYARSFIEELEKGDTADYVIVNLGRGKEWLSTRLYILSLLFAQEIGIKAVLFLKTVTGTQEKFVGWASPQDIRWALAQQYPWLESAYAKAYSDILSNEFVGVNEYGALRSKDATNPSNQSIELLRQFLEGLQTNNVLPHQEADWMELPSMSNNPTSERTQWLTAELIEKILEDFLIKVNIKESKKDTAKIKEYLLLNHNFLAVVDSKERFKYLVKREKLLEQTLTD